MNEYTDRQTKAMKLLKEISEIDAELNELIISELLSNDERPSPLLKEIKDKLQCSTLWVLMLYQRANK